MENVIFIASDIEPIAAVKFSSFIIIEQVIFVWCHICMTVFEVDGYDKCLSFYQYVEQNILLYNYQKTK